jgi:hypothetical protein
MRPLPVLITTLGLASTAWARPPVPTAAETAQWPTLRARSGGAQGGVVLVESAPPAPASLGPHQGLRDTDLDDCWLQHAGAADQDLQVAFCAELSVGGNGAVKADVALDLERDPTRLGRCVQTVLERIESARDAPAQGTICRAVQTHTSAAARERWRTDPRAKVREPVPPDAAWGTVVVGRAHREGATRLAGVAVAVDELGGERSERLARPAPLGAKDRAVATARRHLDAGKQAVRACAGRHVAWRDPGVPVTVDLVLSVSDMGVVDLEGGPATPAAYADLGACIAAALDPGIGATAGDLRLVVPVTVRGG